MGLFKKEKSLDQLEERRERIRVEQDIATGEANIAERKAVIKRLEKEYGGGWKKILGVSSLTDLSTLKSFLVGSKSKMKGMTAPKPAASATVPESTRNKLWGNFGK